MSDEVDYKQKLKSLIMNIFSRYFDSDTLQLLSVCDLEELEKTCILLLDDQSPCYTKPVWTFKVDAELAKTLELVVIQKGKLNPTWNDAVSIALGYNDFNHFKQTMLVLDEEEEENN